jgi:hypothetical protein
MPVISSDPNLLSINATKPASMNLLSNLVGFDPSSVRMAASGLPFGGGWNPTAPPETIGFSIPDIAGTAAGSISASSDWRVRISLASGSTIFYKDPANELMAPLNPTNGVVFPYTPAITITHSAGYQAQPLTHSNYSQQYFTSSEVQDITIQGDFTVQNAIEGQYLLAAIYFFRSATKMFFGDNAKNQGFSGNPPPMVFLNGYGSHYFPDVPCVVSSFQHVLSNDTDYINVPAPNRGMTRLPVTSSITIMLKPVYSRKSLHTNFGLSDFASGKLIGTASSGGFL